MREVPRRRAWERDGDVAFGSSFGVRCERDGRRVSDRGPAPEWTRGPHAASQVVIAYGARLRGAVICRPLRVNQPVTSPQAVDGISDTWTARGRCGWARRADWRGETAGAAGPAAPEPQPGAV